MKFPLPIVATLLTSGCGQPLGLSTLPPEYSVGSLFVLAGGTGGDDVWLRHESSAQDVPMFHFDGSNWTAVPVAALGEGRPLVMATASPTRDELWISTIGNDSIFRMDAAGEADDVSAGLPSGIRAMNRFGEPVFVATYTYATGTTPEQATVHRRDGETWTALGSPPGQVGTIRILDDGAVVISGTLPHVVNEPDVEYYATLEGSDWTVTPTNTPAPLPGSDVVRSADDVWRLVQTGSAPPWTLAHLDGATWTSTTVEVPPSYTDDAVVTWTSRAIVPGEGEGLRLILDRYESRGVDGDGVLSLAVADLDGATLSEPTNLGRYGKCYVCAPLDRALWLGQLPDGDGVFLVPNTSTAFVGALR